MKARGLELAGLLQDQGLLTVGLLWYALVITTVHRSDQQKEVYHLKTEG